MTIAGLYEEVVQKCSTSLLSSVSQVSSHLLTHHHCTHLTTAPHHCTPTLHPARLLPTVHCLVALLLSPSHLSAACSFPLLFARRVAFLCAHIRLTDYSQSADSLDCRPTCSCALLQWLVNVFARDCFPRGFL